MLNNGDYTLRITTPSGFIDGVAHISEEFLTLSSSAGTREIYYADILDLRLINYHMFLYLISETIELSWLGKDTESFFEHVWAAINKQSEKALFTTAPPERKVEGDYEYHEFGGSRAESKGRAKIHLYPDGICIFPHNYGSRRIPLCFATDISEKGYELTVTLDTKDSYTIARMGQETTPFVNKLRKYHKECLAIWEQQHNDLNAHLSERLGDRRNSLEVMSSLPVKITCGLFTPDSDQFYLAAIKSGKAAVELIIGESAATYLYEFDCDEDSFEKSLRHAMEAVNQNREVIYADEQMLQDKPLYRMAIARSYHVSFLRSKMVGKLIHNNTWEDRLREFFN